MTVNRRSLLIGGMVATLATHLRASGLRAPRILLRSSWQVVNIGDIAHTPGVLALIEKHLPNAEVTLWASGNISSDVEAMEQRRFPKLKIVKGTIGGDGKASNADLQTAVNEADFLLHGSGPMVVAEKDVAAFVKHTQKPFGVYGITFSGTASEETRTLLSQAKFFYFRDSVSLANAKANQITCPIMEFSPDGAFACDLRDDQSAEKFLKSNELHEGKFVCCIPRFRWTPYWKIHNRPIDEQGKKKSERNLEMAEHDHAPLRDAITAVVRETGLKVLVCPEDQSQMDIGKEWIVDKLPQDVLKQIVWRENFWLTDEALSVYVRSAGLFGLEMHSPIMCIGNGIPAIVGRFEEQTSKGFMWRDIGLNDWLFDFDNDEQLRSLTKTVLDMIRDPDGAKAKVAAAAKLVSDRHAATMGTLGAMVS